MVERGPEKAGVGGSIPSLATTSPFLHVPSSLIRSITPYFSVLRVSARTAFLDSAGSLTAMRRMRITKEKMCGHGFRATARTSMVEQMHIRTEFIELELGHQVIDPNGGEYDLAAFLRERRLMMPRWADYLDDLTSEKAVPTLKPIPLTHLRAIMVPG